MRLVSFAKNAVGIATKVPVTAIASLASGLVGLGVGAAVSAKVTQAVMHNKLDYTALSLKESSAINAWLYAILTQTFQMNDQDATAVLQNVAVLEEANNPFIKTPFVDIYNNWLNKASLGHPNEYNALCQQQFQREMQPLIEYFHHAGLLRKGLDTGQVFFHQTRKLNKSESLMLIYTNTISMLYLSLVEETNKVPVTKEEYQQKSVDIRKRIEQINHFKEQAYREILEERNSFVAKVVKQMIFRLPTRRQKALSEQKSLLEEIERQKDREAEEDVLFIESDTDSNIGPLYIDKKDKERLVDPLEIIAAAAEADYIRKKHHIESSKLFTLSEKVAKRSTLALGDIASNDISKARANLPKPTKIKSKRKSPILPQFDVTMVERSIEHANSLMRNSTHKSIMNKLLTNYAFNNFKIDGAIEALVKLPHTHLSDEKLYRAPGDIGQEVKRNIFAERSAQFVPREYAGRAAKELADITFLSKINKQFASAYNYEVAHGHGATSPLAYILLKQQQISVEELKNRFKEFLRSDLVLRLIDRFLHFYPDAELNKSEKTVRFGESTTIKTKAIDLIKGYEDGTDGGRLKRILEKLAWVEDGYLFADLRQSLATLLEQGHLVDRLLAEIKVDPSLQTDLQQLPIDDPRSIAAESFAVLAADPNIDVEVADHGQSLKLSSVIIKQLPFKKTLQLWVNNTVAIKGEATFSKEDQQAINHAKHNFLSRKNTYSHLLKSAHDFVQSINTVGWGKGKLDPQKLIDITHASLYIDFDKNTQSFNLNEFAFANIFNFNDFIKTMRSMNDVLVGYSISTHLASFAAYINRVHHDIELSSQQMSSFTKLQKQYIEGISKDNQMYLQSLREDLTEAQQQRDIAEDQLTRLKEATEEKDRKTLAKIHELEDLVRTNGDMANQLKVLETQVIESEKVAEDLQKKLSAVNKEYDAYRKNVDDHTAKAIQMLISAYNILKDEITSKKTAVDNLQLKLESEKVRIATQKKECRNNLMEVLAEQFKPIFEEQQVRFDEEPFASYLEDHPRDIELKIHQLMSKITMQKINAQIKIIENAGQLTLDVYKQQIEGYNEDISQKQQQYDSAVVKLNKLKDEREAILINGKSIKETLKDAETDAGSFKKDLDQIRAELARIVSEQENFKENVEKRFADLAELVKQKLENINLNDFSNMSIATTDGHLPSIGLGNIQIHSSEKSDALQARIKVIEYYINKLKIKKSSRIFPTFNTKPRKVDAFNAILSAMYIAQIHRNHFGSPNNTKSSVEIAKRLLPANKIERIAFVSFLASQVKRIVDIYQNSEKINAENHVVPNSLKLLLYGNYDKVAQNMTAHKLARIFKDAVRIQYATTHNGQKPVFLSRHIPNLNWDTQHEQLFRNQPELINKYKLETVDPDHRRTLEQGLQKDQVQVDVFEEVGKQEAADFASRRRGRSFGSTS